MELILLHKGVNAINDNHYCFNPCFIGTYSFTLNLLLLHFHLAPNVLILVLLELILLLTAGGAYTITEKVF